MTGLDAVAAAVGLPDDVPPADIVDVTHDSRAVEPGWLFCCVRGSQADGHRFAPDAVAAGAAALMVDHRLELPVPQLIVPDVRAAMGSAAAAVHHHPSRQLTVIGVTGTNGKSSVVQLLADIWGRVGKRTEIFGTLTGSRTTPEGPDLQRSLRDAHERGVRMVAMEVSSHALALHRVAGTRFAAAIFTNLGRDHLDFHHDQASYFEAKARLFDPVVTPLAVVNGDDPYGARLLERLAAMDGMTTVAYGLADAEGLTLDGPISRFRWRGHEVVLHLAGHHNVANALAAATAGAELGLDLADIADALCATEPVRGRFELVDIGQPFTVAVDYAHTPDALVAVLAAARQVSRGRVVLVFGCGGDRDHDKRPEMGAAAQREADVVIVTSDNPRGEDPDAIIAAVVGGMDPAATTAIVEPDRRRAISIGLAAARPGDVVVIAGKGHETVQVIGQRELPFDDRQVVVEELGART
ncbi:MAG: UDP-N-acetylmuramoyl-L-alanyl-D-glutamate--2,6-diaminopimelate ligase [Acidimicrobiales bacterium]